MGKMGSVSPKGLLITRDSSPDAARCSGAAIPRRPQLPPGGKCFCPYTEGWRLLVVYWGPQ